MNAMVIRERGGPEVLQRVEMAAPELGTPEDVLVRVRAASVNPVDTYLRAGKVPIPLRYPWVLGGDACGVVEKVGAGVTRFAVGDRVFGMLDYTRRPGCYAELALFREDELAAAPAGLGDAELAALPMVSLTSLQCLRDAASVEPGQRVLVCGGAGGIGSVAIPIARDLGAEVVAIASRASREAVLARGAHEVIARDEPGGMDGAKGPFDVILDAVGGYYPKTRGWLASGGTFVTITSLADDDAYTASNFAQHLVRLATTRLAEPFGGVRVRYVGVRPSGARMAIVREMVERGALRPPAIETMPLGEVAEAHRRIESRTTKGKIVLVP